MTTELVNLLIEKYESPELLRFDHIQDTKQRFKVFMDTIFSFEWSRTVDPGIHFGFYYLSFRNKKIRQRFELMFKRFRNYLMDELEGYRKAGIITAKDLEKAADVIVTLMEGLEFHTHFLAENQPFEEFADYSKQLALAMLKGETGSSA
jgi:hypothetical protein